MGITLKLAFVGSESPQLERVEFAHPAQKALYLSVRGKTAGGYTQPNRTFQWTSAVQGLCLLFLKGALYSHPDRPESFSDLTPSLEGEKGSIVASLDYSLDKQPAWLYDMFGISRDGRAFVRTLLRRSNPGLKRMGPACISLNNEMLATGVIKTVWNTSELKTFTEILELYRALEKSCGAVRLDEVTRESIRCTEQGPYVMHSVESERTISAPKADSRFKTPFVRQGTPEGDVFTRVYEQNGALALVSIFSRFENLDVT